MSALIKAARMDVVSAQIAVTVSLPSVGYWFRYFAFRSVVYGCRGDIVSSSVVLALRGTYVEPLLLSFVSNCSQAEACEQPVGPFR